MKKGTITILLIILIVFSSITYVFAGRERPGVRYEHANIIVTIEDRTGHHHRIYNPNFVILCRAGSAELELSVRSFKKLEFHWNPDNAKVWYWDNYEEDIKIIDGQLLRIRNRTIRLEDCLSINVTVR